MFIIESGKAVLSADKCSRIMLSYPQIVCLIYRKDKIMLSTSMHMLWKSRGDCMILEVADAYSLYATNMITTRYVLRQELSQ